MKNTLSSSQIQINSATAAIIAALINYAILLACEISVQSLGGKYNVFVMHAASIVAALVCVGIVEIALSRIRSIVGMKAEDAKKTGAGYDGSSGHIGLIFLWWGLIALGLPAILFRLTNLIIPWELSGIPYGYFAEIYLTFRTLQTWQQYKQSAKLRGQEFRGHNT